MIYPGIPQEKLEEALDTMTSPGWKSVEQIMQSIAIYHNNQVLGYNLSSSPAEGLIALKQQNEGIHWFIKELKQHRNKLMPKPTGGKSGRSK